MAAALYVHQGVELVIKRVDTACQGPTCKALRAFRRCPTLTVEAPKSVKNLLWSKNRFRRLMKPHKKFQNNPMKNLTPNSHVI